MAKWGIINIDPWLKDYEGDINLRMDRYKEQKERLLGVDGKLIDFANAHKYYGFHKTKTGWIYREWAPNADGLYLIGDFNNWDRHSHPMRRINNEDWEIEIKGIRNLPHGSRVKVLVDANGKISDRIPLYATRVEMDENLDYAGIIQNPRKKFKWEDESFKINRDKLLIYEAHINFFLGF